MENFSKERENLVNVDEELDDVSRLNEGKHNLKRMNKEIRTNDE